MGIMPGLKPLWRRCLAVLVLFLCCGGRYSLGFIEIMTIAFMPELSGYRDALPIFAYFSAPL